MANGGEARDGEPIFPSKPPANLLNLPDELLLKIVADGVDPTLGCAPYKSMAKLALTNYRLSKIVRSTLLQQQSVSISLERTHCLARTLLNLPKFAEKITSLEISAYETLAQRKTKSPLAIVAEYIDAKTAHQCAQAIRTLNSSKIQPGWYEGILEGDPIAYFGLLLMLIPNLTHLLLGPGSSDQYPILNEMLVTEFRHLGGPSVVIHSDFIPSISYMKDVLEHLRSKLTFFELPFFWRPTPASDMFPEVHDKLGSFRSFSVLRKLILPASAICRIPQHYELPEDYFPASLEHLIVVDATPSIASLVNYIVWVKLHDKRPGYRKLGRVDVYFSFNTGEVLEIEVTESDLERLGIEIWSFAPERQLWASKVFGQPWKLTEAELLEIEAKVNGG